ncbi:hypothetical protein BST61_g11413 [Cercospora zeina]
MPESRYRLDWIGIFSLVAVYSREPSRFARASCFSSHDVKSGQHLPSSRTPESCVASASDKPYTPFIKTTMM